MNFDSTPAACSQRIVASPTHPTPRNIPITSKLRDIALVTVAALLGSSALLTGWTYGMERSGSTLGAFVGLAAAIGCLIAPAYLTSALRTGSIGRAATSLLLLAICAPFALSGALGQAAAGRQAAAVEQQRYEDGRTRAQEARLRALTALSALPGTRPATELEAEISRLLASRRDLGDCEGWLSNSAARAVCIDVGHLRAELARAEARTKHQDAIERADAALSTSAAPRPASADAVTLSRLAGRLGVSVPVDLMADLMTILAVILVELGGGIALGLVDWSPAPIRCAVQRHRASRRIVTSLESKRSPPVLSLAAPMDSAINTRRDSIVERLRSGALEGRQADLARELGIPKTTLRRIVERDADLRMSPLPGGVSRLELVAG